MKCPHCGSEEGYARPATEKFLLIYDKDGDSHKGDGNDVKVGAPICLDCRKRIPIKLINNT